VVARRQFGNNKPLASEELGEMCIVVDRDYSSPGSYWLRKIGQSAEKQQLTSRRDFALCEVVSDQVRRLIETPGQGVVNAEDIVCHWQPDYTDLITGAAAPLEAEVDLFNQDQEVDYVDEKEWVEPEPALDSDSEGVSHPQPLLDAHLPDVPAGVVYTDRGYVSGDDSGVESDDESESVAKDSEATLPPKKPPEGTLEPTPEELQASAEEAREITRTFNRKERRLMDRNSKKVHRQYNLRHSTTVKRRLKTTINNISIQKAQKLFGVAADDSIWKELDQLIAKGVWRYLDPADVIRRVKAGEVILPSTLFLKDKYDAFNVFEKLKARLVACGNFAKDDHTLDIESPTASLTILLMTLEIAARERLFKRAADVGGAYLYGDSKAHHMMKLQPRVTAILVARRPELKKYVGRDGCICVELLKTLYGLKEAGRIWYELISSVLIKDGFEQSSIDKCLFYKYDAHGERVIVVLYVDDLLILSKLDQSGVDVVDMLKATFDEVSEKEGDQLSFLGLEIITHENGDVKVCQSVYLADIILAAGVTGTAPSPANDDLMKERDMTKMYDDPDLYYSLVMKLMYASVRTRPDIQYVVGILSGRVKDPTVRDRESLDRVLRYLNGTIKDGLIYRADGTWCLSMSVDASFNHHFDAKGHSGFVVFAADGSAGVLFKSLKQKTVANSSCESELIALHEAVLNLLWIARIYCELGYEQVGTIKIQQDNKAAILLSSQNPVNFKGRSKFINRLYFSVFEYVQDGTVELVYTGTDDTIADFLTKSLIGDKYRKFKVTLMGASSTA
jgi:hypothetical protein